jgi:hypothetical protein
MGGKGGDAESYDDIFYQGAENGVDVDKEAIGKKPKATRQKGYNKARTHKPYRTGATQATKMKVVNWTKEEREAIAQNPTKRVKGKQMVIDKYLVRKGGAAEQSKKEPTPAQSNQTAEDSKTKGWDTTKSVDKGASKRISGNEVKNPEQDWGNLKAITWNTMGLTGTSISKEEIPHLASREGAEVLILTETKLTDKSNIKSIKSRMPDYLVYHSSVEGWEVKGKTREWDKERRNVGPEKA